MAISLEELAVGALEGTVGPWTLAIGAGAIAVALAAGSARPLRRMSATGAFVVGRTGQVNLAGLTGWIGGVRRSWQGLVAEARAEYEAGRRDVSAPMSGQRAIAEAVSDVETGSVTVVQAAPPPAELAADGPSDVAGRDRRGRFVRRATTTNGTQPE